MNEQQRLTALFKNLFNGDPWLDITILGTLSQVSPQKAALKPGYGGNSIWEIVNHMISWRHVILKRIQGEPKNTPEHNYFLPVDDTSDSAWSDTLEKFDASQQIWLDYLATVDESELNRNYQGSPYSIYDLIHGIIQHDAYHLGQLTLLAKYDL